MKKETQESMSLVGQLVSEAKEPVSQLVNSVRQCSASSKVQTEYIMGKMMGENLFSMQY